MSVVAALLTMAAGCGRVGFDPVPAGDGGMDAAVDGGGDASRDAATDGAGDVGLDAAGDARPDTGDAMVGSPEPQRVFVDTFTTGSPTFVPIPGAALVIPPTVEPREWLVIASGRLRWAGASTPQVKARLRVQGVERGLGGCTGVNGSSGPFQFFDVVTVGAVPVDVSLELRSPEGPVVSLDAPLGSQVIFAQIAMQDTGGGDVTVQLTQPDGAHWPEMRALHHGRLNYQAFMVTRFFNVLASGPVTMTTRVMAGSEASMGHARICSVPPSRSPEGCTLS